MTFNFPTILPPLDGSGAQYAAYGVDDDGSTVVGIYDRIIAGLVQSQAVYWTITGIHALATPAGVDASGGGTEAVVCNSDGSVMYGHAYNAAGLTTVVKWVNGVGTALPFPVSVTGPAGAFVGNWNGGGTTTDGSMAVGAIYANSIGINPHNTIPVYWDGTGVHLLSTGGSTSMMAQSVSRDGVTITGYDVVTGQAIKWVSGVRSTVGSPTSEFYNEDSFCSPNGDLIIGMAGTSIPPDQGYYAGGVFTAIPGAIGCNETSILGRSIDLHAVIYNLSGGITQKLAWAPNDIASTPTYITPDGLTIVGSGTADIIRAEIWGGKILSMVGNGSPTYSFPTPPRYRAADFLQATLNLLPRGRAWAKYAGSNLATALNTLMPTYERSSLSATGLLYDIFPAQTLQLIPEWNSSLGLPDPCSGPAPTTDEQRAQIVARFIASGGQSVPYIISFAANLGFEITITETVGGSFLMGVDLMGVGSLGTPEDVFYWFVNAPLIGLHLFEMGVNVMNDPLGRFNNNTVLECEIRALAPAHTVPIFGYS